MRPYLVLLELSLVAASWCAQVPLGVDNHNAGTHSGQVINKDFEEFVEKTRVDGSIPGLSIGIVRPDGQVEYGAWGEKTEDGEPMTPETLYIIASCSKAFASSAVGILIDDFAQGNNVTALSRGLEKLDWSTKIADLLPGEWKLMDEWASSKANLKDILSHVSGLPRHDFAYSPLDSPGDVVQRMRYLRPAFELRQRWSYNNQMYMLASHIISTYSGMPFTKFVKTRIFAPANMTSSTYSVAEASVDGRISQSWTKVRRRIPLWFENDTTEISAGPGGVITSVVDMANWLKILINSGVHPDSNTTVLPFDTFTTTTTASAIVQGFSQSPPYSLVGYGMGWIRFSYKGHEIVYHTGGIPGFSTLTAFLPADKLGIVILINADEKQKQFMAILFKAVSDALGLSSTEEGNDIETLTDMVQRPSLEHKPSQDVKIEPLSLDIEQYSGTYADPGYGTFTLCSTSSPSAYCKSVISDFEPFEDYTNTSAPVKLYAIANAVWGSHLRFTHTSGDAFDVALTALFPDGYGEDTSPFETWETGGNEATAKFVVEDGVVIGVGLMGMVGEMTERERIGGSVKDTAEVWLDRV